MSDEKASAKVPDEPQSGSVFDFLYHDSRRVGSFLAQFDSAGLLQQVRESDFTGRSTSTKAIDGGGLYVPLAARADLSRERSSAEEGHLSQERVYDPFWANACNLLDFLHSRSMLVRDLESAALGQFVLLTGKLGLLDLSFLKSLWKIQGLQDLMLSGFLSAVSASGSKRKYTQENEKKQLGKMMFSLVEQMPHGLQMRITVESGELVWCGLEQESLVGSSIGVALKHGVEISGSWNTLGILDALPDSSTKATGNLAPDPSEIGASLLSNYAPLMRQFMGRPSKAYGITPLLVFRKVGS